MCSMVSDPQFGQLFVFESLDIHAFDCAKEYSSNVPSNYDLLHCYFLTGDLYLI